MPFVMSHRALNMEEYKKKKHPRISFERLVMQQRSLHHLLSIHSIANLIVTSRLCDVTKGTCGPPRGELTCPLFSVGPALGKVSCLDVLNRGPNTVLTRPIESLERIINCRKLPDWSRCDESHSNCPPEENFLQIPRAAHRFLSPQGEQQYRTNQNIKKKKTHRKTASTIRVESTGGRFLPPPLITMIQIIPQVRFRHDATGVRISLRKKERKFSEGKEGALPRDTHRRALCAGWRWPSAERSSWPASRRGCRSCGHRNRTPGPTSADRPRGTRTPARRSSPRTPPRARTPCPGRGWAR